MEKNVLIWLCGEDIILLGGAIAALARDIGGIHIAGATGTRPMALQFNGRQVPFLEKTMLRTLEIDYVILTGRKYNIRTVRYELDFYGLESAFILPDRVCCLAGFSVKKYRNLLASKVSIFSLNCFGGLVSHLFGMPFRSPFVNMFSTEDSFIDFLEADPAQTLFSELQFIESRYEPVQHFDYPVFRCDNLLLYMNHYPDILSAIAKWNERKKRINFDNLFVTMYTDRQDIIERFARLPYKKKICFTYQPSELPSIYTLERTAFDGKELWHSVDDIATGIYQPLDLIDLLTSGRQVPAKQ